MKTPDEILDGLFDHHGEAFGSDAVQQAYGRWVRRQAGRRRESPFRPRPAPLAHDMGDKIVEMIERRHRE